MVGRARGYAKGADEVKEEEAGEEKEGDEKSEEKEGEEEEQAKDEENEAKVVDSPEDIESRRQRAELLLKAMGEL